MDNLDAQETSIPRETSQPAQLDILRKVVGVEEAEFAHQKLIELQQGQFKNSKALDANGELAIAWHGSPRIFDRFDPAVKGEFRWRNEGVHFHSNKNLLDQYAEKAINSFRLAFHDIGQQEVGQDYDPDKPEHLQTAAEVYNKVIEDLIEKGKQSEFYADHGDWTSIQYKNRVMDLDWFGEMFGGGLPTKDNTVKVPGPAGRMVYFGKDIGKVYYATVLNIINPFEMSTRDFDHSFELGEESHKNSGTDGTILHHTDNIVGKGVLEVEGSSGSDSYAVFDPNQIKIIGREINGKFELMPEFTNPL